MIKSRACHSSMVCDMPHAFRLMGIVSRFSVHRAPSNQLNASQTTLHIKDG